MSDPQLAELFRRTRKELRTLRRRLPDVAPRPADDDGCLAEEAEDVIADIEGTAALIRAWLEAAS